MTRRRVLALLGAAAVPGCTGGDGDSENDEAPGGADGEDDGDGAIFGEDGPDGSAPVSEEWRAPVGGAPGPVLTDGSVVVTTADEAVSLDRDTGDRHWTERVRAPRVLRSAPVVADGRVYAASDNGVTAFDGASGERRWQTGDTAWGPLSATAEYVYYNNETYGVSRVALGSGESEYLRSGRTHAIADGTLYVAGNDSTVEAVDPASGEVLWTFAAENEQFRAIQTVAVADDTLYAGTDGGNLYAVDATTGERRWAATGIQRGGVTADLKVEPVVDGGRVYVSGNAGPLYALDAATGDRRWVVETSNTVIPAVADDIVLTTRVEGSGPDTAASLVAIDTDSGDERWSYRIGGIMSRTRSRPVVSDGTAYVATDSETIAVSLQ